MLTKHEIDETIKFYTQANDDFYSYGRKELLEIFIQLAEAEELIEKFKQGKWKEFESLKKQLTCDYCFRSQNCFEDCEFCYNLNDFGIKCFHEGDIQ